MSETCDPRKTGCDCYPFPHRKDSHPSRKCPNGWYLSATDLDKLTHRLSPNAFQNLYMGQWIEPQDPRRLDKNTGKLKPGWRVE